jgi:hypothetical protein
MSEQEDHDSEANGWPRGRFVAFMAAVESVNSYKNLVIAGLTVVIVVLGVLLVNAQNTVGSMAKHIPVMVIPGASSGLYSPGISADNVKNLAIYLIKLPLDITPANVNQRYNEFQKFLSPDELMNFQSQKDGITESIKSHDESRIFVPENYKLQSLSHNQYKMTTYGHYHYFSGNLVLGDHKERITMVFTVAVSATPKNPYGVVIDSFNVAKEGQ